jgi:thiol-disulfide isomerase/thioredoxin
MLTLVLSGATVLGYLAYRAVDAPRDPASAPVTTEEHSHGAAAFADSLPAIMLNDLGGAPTALDTWAGKPMLVNFWATWCAPCLREIPLLKEFQIEQNGVQIVGIAVDRVDPVVSFAAEMDFNYPVLVGQTDAMEAAAALGVEVFALPITVFIDPAGAILGIHTGELHAEHLDNFAAVLGDLDTGRIDRATARARIAGTM